MSLDFGPQSLGVHVDTSGLDALPDRLRSLAKQALRETMQEVEGIARDIAEEHRDTGGEQAGLYTATVEESGYEAAAAIAQYLNPKVEILPEVPRPGDLEGVLGAAAGNTIFDEFGTTERAARPVLMPAAIEGEQIFLKKLEEAGARL